MTDRFGTDVATSKEQIEGTWSIDGEEYDLITEDTSKGTLELIDEYMKVAEMAANAEDPDDLPDDLGADINDFPWEDEDTEEKDFIETVIDEKLIRPKVDVSEAPVRKLRALFMGMMDTWGEGKRVEDAKGEMPLEDDGGN